ncbi:MAG: DEAD/DEAH box helicase [Thiotrichaceae bacterium]|nr:MAG: DEAD/DEAH box helicase [Thiotrichaceae bacterium]
MTPESNSIRLFGITRSKGKMYEFGLPEEDHIAIPEGSNPAELLLLTVGNLGDAAVQYFEADNDNVDSIPLNFSSSYFDALLQSKLAPSLDNDLALLASAAYYLDNRPGSSLVMAGFQHNDVEETSIVRTLRWLLCSAWDDIPSIDDEFSELLRPLIESIANHFLSGTDTDQLFNYTSSLRHLVYQIGGRRDLLLTDIICAVVHKRVSSSSWVNLPQMSGLTTQDWLQSIQKNHFPKELWPSQLLLGNAGIFSGESGLVQMPTSAGKTRSVEMIIRSTFLSGRTNVAIIVAPFRALCHEINQSLREAFAGEHINVTELSDALQPDYLDELEELLGVTPLQTPTIVVLTPEKFLYILRQTSDVIDNLGLVVYDEGHQFDSGYRGVTYELLLSEIKQLLSDTAQTVLISAVMSNADEIANWLLGDDPNVITGQDLLPTSRSVAFSSWPDDRRGQMMFYEENIGRRPDYFVPRIIEQQELRLIGRETAVRYFPEREESTDISLYLGLRLVPNGAVAIYCGRKVTAEKIVSRSVEIFKRRVSFVPPSNFSNAEEIQRLMNLYILHFGVEDDRVKAAELGIFAHHGNTHHGLRLAIEHAMQSGKIKFVACTSTLAQGVNLPIRYLIVSGVYQGRERIKVRDFQNLMGRAGRAGMHTEGLVIFADSTVYDNRIADSWKFDSAKELLDSNQSEPTTSSLLSILDPPPGLAAMEPDLLVDLLSNDSTVLRELVDTFIANNPGTRIDSNQLTGQFIEKRNLVSAIESYLMAQRSDIAYDDFIRHIEILVSQTLAYSLADDDKKTLLLELFYAIAQRIENIVPDTARQLSFSKTLLSAEQARDIEIWVHDNIELLSTLDTDDDLLDFVWEILLLQIGSKFATTVQPVNLPNEIAILWISGCSYHEIYEHVVSESGTKPWGENRRRKLNYEDIFNFCEHTLGFDFPLGIAAITQFMTDIDEPDDISTEPIMKLQKSMKYGIANELAISCYEFGIADRMLSQKISTTLQDNSYEGLNFIEAMGEHGDNVRTVMLDYPEYFNNVLTNI